MIRIVAAVLGLGMISIAVAGCESTAERSAQLARHAGTLAIGRGVRVTRAAANVTVVSTTALHDANGAAAVVALRSTATGPVYGLPITIRALNASGATVGDNTAAGLDPSLTHVAQLAPGQVSYWVDDELTTSGTPARIVARVGAPRSSGAPLPSVTLSAAKLVNDPASGLLAGGTVRNATGRALATINVEAVALRGSTVIAAGRGAVSNLAAGASSPFRVFFIGNPTGGRLVVSAAPAGAS